jgi:hypothetical protein
MERTIEELNEIVKSLLEENKTRNLEEQFCILAGMSRMDARVCDTRAFVSWCMKNSTEFWAHTKLYRKY